jgi:hypothetical protein
MRLMNYFEERIRPVIKAKFGAKQEQNMLACINQFAHFAELLEFQGQIGEMCRCDMYQP